MNIVITQRIVLEPVYQEIRDTLSHDWIEYLNNQGYHSFPIPNRINNLKSFLDSVRPDAVIFSSGNDLAGISEDSDAGTQLNKIRDDMENRLMVECLNRKIPVLGICRGFQFLNRFFGGKVIQNLKTLRDLVVVHAGSTHDIEILNYAMAIAAGSSCVMVNSYHNNGVLIESLATGLITAAVSQNVVEAFIHAQLPVVGIQWHPERPGSAVKIDSLLMNGLKTGFSELR